MSTASPALTASLDPRELWNALAQIIEPERVLTRPIERIAYAADASFYRLIPQAVILAKGVEDIHRLFRFSQARHVPMTFRAAGTSLSGQAVTDGILVEVAKHWREVRVEEGGKRVRVQPGVIGGHVNQALKAYRAKMGPDPASINACMMGGILSNNSSGMCCGVAQNAYHTLQSITFVLPSGTVIDTAHPEADEILHQREPRLYQGLLDLKREIQTNPRLAERIRAAMAPPIDLGHGVRHAVTLSIGVAALTGRRGEENLKALADRLLADADAALYAAKANGRDRIAVSGA